jgi:hypothetical protein
MALQQIADGLSFGNQKHNGHFLSFFVKSVAYTLPAILLGILVDRLVDKLKKKKRFGDKPCTYVVLQFAINLAILFVVLKGLSYKYASEFQNTLPGMFFSTLFFGVQTKWFANIDESF